MSFLFVANNLAIDLVNTEVVAPQGRTDLLSDPRSLKKWFSEAGCGKNIGCSQDDLEAVIDLRAAIRHILELILQNKAIAAADLSQVNDLSNRLVRNLVADKNAFKFEVKLASVDDARALISLTLCELLASTRLKSLRKCASEKCILFFVDTSKNQHRQWCSMEVCGNREKVKSFYERNK